MLYHCFIGVTCRENPAREGAKLYDIHIKAWYQQSGSRMIPRGPYVFSKFTTLKNPLKISLNAIFRHLITERCAAFQSKSATGTGIWFEKFTVDATNIDIDKKRLVSWILVEVDYWFGDQKCKLPRNIEMFNCYWENLYHGYGKEFLAEHNKMKGCMVYRAIESNYQQDQSLKEKKQFAPRIITWRSS